MNTLVEIQNYYRFTTDKNTNHTYLPIYDTLFKSLKDKPINLLEIGVNYGGSLLLWEKYFTNDQSKIYGVDVDIDRIQKNIFTNSKIKVIHNDIKKCNLDTFNTIDFDIIIDDGSHYIEDQLFAYDLLKPKIKKGGFYIIEDIQPPNYNHFLNLSIQTLNQTTVLNLNSCANQNSWVTMHDNVLFVYSNT